MSTDWQHFAERTRYFDDLGLALDLSRINSPAMSSLANAPFIKNALLAMQQLEGGAIANNDENRQVGHYWLRSPEKAPAGIAPEILATNEKIAEFAAGVLNGAIKTPSGATFTDALLIGIGGSALGPQFVSDALAKTGQNIKLHFSDNTDPDGIRRTLLDLGKRLNTTLFIVISKSGGTVETRNGMLEIKHFLQAQGCAFERQAVVITCKDSKLDKLAKDGNWLDRFHMWDWVGGRTSIFSAVGLLPAALEGIDVAQFLAGAKAMDRRTLLAQPEENPALQLALTWFFAGEGHGSRDMVVLPYKDRLGLFGKYLQQLVMESLGKELDRNGLPVHQGLVVYGNKGSTDQHAYVQQLREGPDNFFALFIEVLQDFAGEDLPSSNLEVEAGITSGDYLSGFLHGTKLALSEKGRHSLTLTLNEINPATIGGLIALFERAVGFYAEMTGINAYNQPGVEAGKKAAEQIVVLQKKIIAELEKVPSGGKFSAQELAHAIGAPAQEELVYHIMLRFAANNRLGIKTERGSRPADTYFYTR